MRSFIHVLALGGSDRLMPVVEHVFTARPIIKDALTKEMGGTAGTLFQPESIRVSFSKRTGRKEKRKAAHHLGEKNYNATRGGGYPLDRPYTQAACQGRGARGMRVVATSGDSN
jgi:hypothetical protein